jgi:Ni/Fe-hydrogenase subunit HybB-like protein
MAVNLRRLAFPLCVLAFCWLGLAGFVWATIGQFPERVATHFGWITGGFVAGLFFWITALFFRFGRTR